MPITAWFMDSSDADQRTPHQQTPPAPVTTAALTELGVLQWHLTAFDPAADEVLAAVRAERGYSYTDTITISPDKLPNYEEKLRTFFKEHLHTDEEIRLCLDGSGYFDVRDREDKWIRIAVEKGDMIVLPAGIYHRFTLDERNYMKAMRLFVGEPVWTPYNRLDAGTDEMAPRKSYVGHFVAARREEGADTAAAVAAAGGAGASAGAGAGAGATPATVA